MNYEQIYRDDERGFSVMGANPDKWAMKVVFDHPVLGEIKDLDNSYRSKQEAIAAGRELGEQLTKLKK
ncbi:MAG: hypothetical protein CMP08_07800 [Xanthomonadales bacterium]|nr:hypothetical protein [Xanthomonadales bacterium]|tara:strand:- start:638 stop:841 length:204 start_codon:yes stop_codon:yes gene_type:complete